MKKRGRPRKKTIENLTDPFLYSGKIEKSQTAYMDDKRLYDYNAEEICTPTTNSDECPGKGKAVLKELIISTNPSGLNNFKFFINPLCVDYVIPGPVVCVITLNGREFYYRGAINELLSILENN